MTTSTAFDEDLDGDDLPQEDEPGASPPVDDVTAMQLRACEFVSAVAAGLPWPGPARDEGGRRRPVTVQTRNRLTPRSGPRRNRLLTPRRGRG